MTESEQHLAELANQAKAWPFAEARSLRDRLARNANDDLAKPVLFETGFGPSGLPHIGTFGEVVRTSMVRRAFETLTNRPTRLICFSDDMDGLRKVPDNLPAQQMAEEMAKNLHKPLSKIDDPYGHFDSFGEYNNNHLQLFLEFYGFECEFVSATKKYESGDFDQALLHVLTHYEAIRDVILPTLGSDRRETYSPFLPICPDTERVLQAKIIALDKDGGGITYINPETGGEVYTKVTGGKCKLQWKADWAMRWYALGVDYEMSGKDLIDSVTLSSRIVKILKGTPPAGFSYELFLDHNGEKISKSKGNGLSIEQWLSYGSPESLTLFMYSQPKRAKRLYFNVIPKAVDEYFTHVNKLTQMSMAEKLENPAWHINHKKNEEPIDMPVSFSLLLNLAAVCSAETAAELWGYIEHYAPGITPQSHPHLDQLAGNAVRFYQDRVRIHKKHRQANDREKEHIKMLREALLALPDDVDAVGVQTVVYATGKDHYENLRDWFTCLYETMLGQEQGPRMGSFFKLYGLAKSVELCDDVLADRLAFDIDDLKTQLPELFADEQLEKPADSQIDN